MLSCYDYNKSICHNSKFKIIVVNSKTKGYLIEVGLLLSLVVIIYGLGKFIVFPCECGWCYVYREVYKVHVQGLLATIVESLIQYFKFAFAVSWSFLLPGWRFVFLYEYDTTMIIGKTKDSLSEIGLLLSLVEIIYFLSKIIFSYAGAV